MMRQGGQEPHQASFPYEDIAMAYRVLLTEGLRQCVAKLPTCSRGRPRHQYVGNSYESYAFNNKAQHYEYRTVLYEVLIVIKNCTRCLFDVAVCGGFFRFIVSLYVSYLPNETKKYCTSTYRAVQYGARFLLHWVNRKRTNEQRTTYSTRSYRNS